MRSRCICAHSKTPCNKRPHSVPTPTVLGDTSTPTSSITPMASPEPTDTPGVTTSPTPAPQAFPPTGAGWGEGNSNDLLRGLVLLLLAFVIGGAIVVSRKRTHDAG